MKPLIKNIELDQGTFEIKIIPDRQKIVWNFRSKVEEIKTRFGQILHFPTKDVDILHSIKNATGINLKSYRKDFYRMLKEAKVA